MRLRDRLREPLFTLQVDGADDARRTCLEIARQVDDYVLPRLTRPEAPLLAVVGGSTGSGKSTLVNALAGSSVSAVGVLRPTTRSPVLICGADDKHWFTGDRVFATLPRATGPATDGDEGVLHVVECDTLPPGLAVVDAPDFDSVVEPNRELAVQLLAAADLWLFVTTAARYADAVPWSFLLEARDRGVPVAVVVDRCPEGARQEASEHFAQMLDRRGFGDAPFFVVAEGERGTETLPEDAVAPLRGWLAHVAADEEARDALVARTLSGAVDSFGERLVPAIRTGERQDELVARLRSDVDDAYAAARLGVDNATVDGSLVKGDVLARWRELVGTGELLRSVRSGDEETSERVTRLRAAVADSVQATVLAYAEQAVEHVVTRWTEEPAGRALLAEHTDLRAVSVDLATRLRQVVHAWQDRTTRLVYEASEANRVSEQQKYDGELLGLILVLVTATPAGAAAGTEVAVTRSATRASRKVLEAILGGDTVRQHTAAVRRDLQGETHALLEAEAARYTELLGPANVPANCADRLREVLFGLESVRQDSVRTSAD